MRGRNGTSSAGNNGKQIRPGLLLFLALVLLLSAALPPGEAAAGEAEFHVALVNEGDKGSGDAFALRITGVRDQYGGLIDGWHRVQVSSNLDGELHNAEEWFFLGWVNLYYITLHTVGVHTLTVTVYGGLGYRTLTVNVVGAPDQSGFEMAYDDYDDKVSGVPFNLNINEARDWDGIPHDGYFHVQVSSQQDDRLVHDAEVLFSGGNATVPITLIKVDLHSLRVSVEGVTGSWLAPLVTVVEAPDQSGFEVALEEPGEQGSGASIRLKITEARNRDGTEHHGFFLVQVRSNHDGPVRDSLAAFSHGEAIAVYIRLDTEGEHTLTVSVADVTESRTLTVTVVVEKSGLRLAVGIHEQLGGAQNEADYTPESWMRYTDAVEAGRAVLDNSEATQAEVTAAYRELVMAWSALRTAGRVDTVAIDETVMTKETTVTDDGRTEETFTLTDEEFIKAMENIPTGTHYWVVIENDPQANTRVEMPSLDAWRAPDPPGDIGIIFNNADGPVRLEFSEGDIARAAAAEQDLSLSIRPGDSEAVAERLREHPGIADATVVSTPNEIIMDTYGSGAFIDLALPPVTPPDWLTPDQHYEWQRAVIISKPPGYEIPLLEVVEGETQYLGVLPVSYRFQAEGFGTFAVILLAPEDESRFEVALMIEGDKVSSVTFGLQITKARDSDGIVHNGDFLVQVWSDLDDHDNVYNDVAPFSEGNTAVGIALSTVGEHTLTVSVAGVTEPQALAVKVEPKICKHQYGMI